MAQAPAAPAAVSLRIPSDARLQDELLSDPSLKSLSAELRETGGGHEAGRRRLLADGLRVTVRMIPDLMKAVAHAREVSGLGGRAVEVFVCDEPRQNASCIDFGEGPVFLLYTASLLERMTPNELLFVTGHELAHAAFNHHALPASALLRAPGGLPPKRALALMSWSRRAEMSCDRVGLACNKSLQDATTALIKLTCGLKEPLLKFHVEDYLSQMKELEALSDAGGDREDWFSSHPFNPLRVAALHAFWDSQPAAALLGRASARLSAPQLEERIDALLASMEPERAEAREGCARDAVLWGGYWIAAADGKIVSGEGAAIRAAVPAEAMRKADEEVRAAKDGWAHIKEKFLSAAKKCLKLPASDRHALLQKLIVIARADGSVDEKELAVLREACRALGVNPGFVDQIMKLFS